MLNIFKKRKKLIYFLSYLASDENEKKKIIKEKKDIYLVNNITLEKKEKITSKNYKILDDKIEYYYNLENLSNKLRISQNKAKTKDIQKNKNSALIKASDNKGSKSKNYYGYEDKQNLEETINNHSYFESVHSKKNK